MMFVCKSCVIFTANAACRNIGYNKNKCRGFLQPVKDTAVLDAIYTI